VDSATPPISPVKEKAQPPIPSQNHAASNDVAISSHERANSTASSSSSSPYVGPKYQVARKSVPKLDGEQDWNRSSTPLNARDELLVSLLASEAVVDSRDFDILSSEDVEELKKENQILQSRLVAATRKLALETKIRDAAKSLVKVNAAHKKVSKQSEEQLEAANKRVDNAQTDFLRVSQRANDVHRRLMEHRAGVLSLSVRSMEKKLAPKTHGGDSGYNSPMRSGTPSVSPPTSVLSATFSPSARFDGAHLFAGHIDAIIPKRQVTPDAAAAEVTALETKLKAATEALTAAGKKQADMQRELSLLRLEKQQVETSMTFELQSAEETISALEQELPRLENLEQQHLEEKSRWEQERAALQEKVRQAEELEEHLRGLEARDGETALVEKALFEEKERSQRELKQKEEEIKLLEETLEQERAAMQEARMEELAQLQGVIEQQQDDLEVLKNAGQELEDGLGAIHILVETFGILSRDPTLPGLVQAVGSHLQKTQKKVESHENAEEEWSSLRRKLEEDIRSGLDKREALQMELEEARRTRDVATVELNKRLAESPAVPAAPLLPAMEINVPIDTDIAKITSIFLPLWAKLPSPEARAAKFGTGQQRQLYTGSPTSSIPKSIADLDVRSLKALYDSTRAGSPPVGTGGAFSFEAFATRVQALIADDRSLIERLFRFAQAHDLLKKNAERAQKLAQDGTNSLETYRGQVKTLEERNDALTLRVLEFQEEVQFLQDAIEQLSEEKQQLEGYATEQGEMLRELTEANNSLSARTLTLAEEAANGADKVRKQLEAQLAECQSKLRAAQAELSAFQESEQTQRIALMDELNSVQTENDRLRVQLRAIKR
jgi:hypothetical protein